jgi:FlaG/FlaF family flagellin (archaellin)
MAMSIVRGLDPGLLRVAIVVVLTALCGSYAVDMATSFAQQAAG